MATFSSIKAKIKGLIDKSNAKTGESDTDLTSAVDKLIYGYGGIVIPDGYLKPSGIKEITENGTHNVAKYESIDVNVAGGSGECSGEHVITVDELPTENIDEGAIYKVQEELPFIAIIMVDAEGPMDLGALYEQYGIGTFEYYTVDTKPTEDIKVIDEAASIYPCYYVKDENDIFFCVPNEETGESEWISFGLMMNSTFGGCISNMSEATNSDCYYGLGGTVINYYKYDAAHSVFDKLIFEKNISEITAEEKTVTPSESTQAVTPSLGVKYLSKVIVNPIPDTYVYATGTKTINENGTCDVKQYASANVTVPTVLTVFDIADVPDDLPDGSVVYVIGGN